MSDIGRAFFRYFMGMASGTIQLNILTKLIA